MVQHEVPFVGNSTLLYTWRNLNAFFAEYGIKTLDEFDKFYSPENTQMLGFEDITKIVGFGLQRKDRVVTTDEVNDLISDYMEDHTMMEVLEAAIKAQMAAMVTAPTIAGEPKGAQKKPPKPLKN